MADTTEEKKKKTTSKVSKSKKKNNDPKWKTKKENKKSSTTVTSKKSGGNNKKTSSVKKDTKKESKTTTTIEEKRITPLPKSESSKRVDKEKLEDKFHILDDEVITPVPFQKETVKPLLEHEKVEQKTDSDSKIPNVIGARHFNFTLRVCTLVALILLFLVMGIVLLFKSIGYELGNSTTYSEYTSNNYSVCTEEIGVYDNNCMSKDLDYISSIVKTIHASFNYEAVYSKEVSIDSNYYVIGRLKVYDKNNVSHIRYTREDSFLESTKLKVQDEVVSFSTDVQVDFASYKEFVEDYMRKTGVLSGAELEVSLYLENDGVSRKISYINIPLTEETFMITSSNLDNQNQLVIFNDKKKMIDPFYMFICIICFFTDGLLLIYLINFIYMVSHLDNKYNATLKKILKDYDKIIVNATSEYQIPEEARIIEVATFKELLDARNSLEKPIVYERVNNVKSRFYLEDEDKVYIYKIKDEGK